MAQCVFMRQEGAHGCDPPVYGRGFCPPLGSEGRTSSEAAPMVRICIIATTFARLCEKHSLQRLDPHMSENHARRYAFHHRAWLGFLTARRGISYCQGSNIDFSRSGDWFLDLSHVGGIGSLGSWDLGRDQVRASLGNEQPRAMNQHSCIKRQQASSSSISHRASGITVHSSADFLTSVLIRTLLE